MRNYFKLGVLVFGFSTCLGSCDSEASNADANTPQVTADTCDAIVGNKVKFNSSEDVYAKLTDLQKVEKDEFETNDEFLARKIKANKELEGLIFVATDYLPVFSTYDADTQQLSVGVFPWSITEVGWENVFKKRGFNHKQHHGLHLEELRKETGKYSGTYVINASYYSLYDRPKSVSGGSWGYDRHEVIDTSHGKMDMGYIVIDVPIEDAPKIKETLRIGTYFTPKAPYTKSALTQERAVNPSTGQQMRFNNTTKVIFGDIACTVVTTKRGKVLKSVRVGY